MANRAEIRLWDGENKEPLIELLRLQTPRYFAPAEEQDFNVYLENHADNYFTLVEGGTTIGCGGINYGFDGGKTARLSWDIIHPRKQGMGYGSDLVKHRLREIAKHPGIERVVVRTTTEAEKFYEKFGFELVYSEKDFWASGFHLRELHLRLRD